jgi:REP element-mobilizing transposase RayT
MHLSPLGKLAKKYWQAIPQHFSNVELETFIIMPNHIHGIITINNPLNYVRYQREYNVGRHQLCISPVAKSLPIIIGTFKAAVTRATNKNDAFREFKWQTRYYDHVIRKRESLYKISQYILNNPTKWESDRNNPENIC